MTKEERRFAWGMKGLIVLMVAVIVVLAGSLVWALTHTGRSRPADIDYETTRVLRVLPTGLVQVPQVAGFDRPSIALGDALPLEFNRCNEEGRDLTAIAQTWWVTEDGERVPQGEPTEVVILDGCQTVRVELGMPNRVAVINVDRFASAEGMTGMKQWRLVGSIDPVDGGLSAVEWVSEPFAIVNGDPPRFPPSNPDTDTGVG